MGDDAMSPMCSSTFRLYGLHTEARDTKHKQKRAGNVPRKKKIIITKINKTKQQVRKAPKQNQTTMKKKKKRERIRWKKKNK